MERVLILVSYLRLRFFGASGIYRKATTVFYRQRGLVEPARKDEGREGSVDLAARGRCVSCKAQRRVGANSYDVFGSNNEKCSSRDRRRR